MSYDLNILVVEQQTSSNPQFKSFIQILSEPQDEVRYHGIWPYMTGTQGIWYSLGHGDDVLFNALSIIRADFDKDLKNLPMPYWIKDEEDRSNLIPLTVVDKYKDDFIKIMSYLISESPVRTIMFLARFQSHDREIICGVLSYEEFWLLCNNGNIYFNICYIIRG